MDSWPAMCIHGDKSQPERDWVLKGKRNSEGRFVKPDLPSSKAQELALLAMTALVIKDVLPVLMPKLHTLVGSLLLQELIQSLVVSR